MRGLRTSPKTAIELIVVTNGFRRFEVAKRCNPACKTLYTRLSALVKAPEVINIAIAHKLLRQAFAMATMNMAYSGKYA